MELLTLTAVGMTSTAAVSYKSKAAYGAIIIVGSSIYGGGTFVTQTALLAAAAGYHCQGYRGSYFVMVINMGMIVTTKTIHKNNKAKD